MVDERFLSADEGQPVDPDPQGRLGLHDLQCDDRQGPEGETARTGRQTLTAGLGDAATLGEYPFSAEEGQLADSDPQGRLERPEEGGVAATGDELFLSMEAGRIVGPGLQDRPEVPDQPRSDRGGPEGAAERTGQQTKVAGNPTGPRWADWLDDPEAPFTTAEINVGVCIRGTLANGVAGRCSQQGGRRRRRRPGRSVLGQCVAVTGPGDPNHGLGASRLDDDAAGRDDVCAEGNIAAAAAAARGEVLKTVAGV